MLYARNRHGGPHPWRFNAEVKDVLTMGDTGLKKTTGLVLGKFLPPHRGHKLLIDFALNHVDELTVVVGTLAAEPIPGALRHAWMRQLFPKARVVHLTDENPQYPEEHPDFWKIWHDSLRKFLPAGPDYVFASEPYGFKLAEVLGSEFVPVDIARDLVPVSGTKIRNEPFRYWNYIPDCVRSWFVKRVCIFGPESTGKTTLARNLAEGFGTCWAGEYARTLLEAKDGVCEEGGIPRIARGQIALEEAMKNQADKLLFLDTDLLETEIWSDVLYGRCEEWISREAANRTADLYLLTEPDVPWVADKVRYLPSNRWGFFELCRRRLEELKLPFAVIRGSWEERFETACEAVRNRFELACIACPTSHKLGPGLYEQSGLEISV